MAGQRIDKGSDRDSLGEASIASMAAGLLYHRSSDDLAGLLELLFMKRTSAHDILLPALAAKSPEQMLVYALQHANGQSPTTMMLDALQEAMRNLPSQTMMQAIPILDATRARKGELGKRAASILREFDPENVEAWDEYAEQVLQGASGFKLHPVPQTRFARAIEVATARPEAGLDWMSSNQGPEEQQAAMARLALRQLSENALRPYLFGRLAERKLIDFSQMIGGHRFRPWLQLARALIHKGDESGRQCVIYGIFFDARSLLHPEIAPLIHQLYLQHLSVNEADTAVRGLMYISGQIDTWPEHLNQLRSQHRTDVDQAVFESLSRSSNAKRQELVNFWKALPKQDLSVEVACALTRIEAGETLDSVFGHNWWELCT